MGRFTVFIPTRVEPDQARKLDALADVIGVKNRSEVIRTLIENAIFEPVAQKAANGAGRGTGPEGGTRR